MSGLGFCSNFLSYNIYYNIFFSCVSLYVIIFNDMTISNPNFAARILFPVDFWDTTHERLLSSKRCAHRKYFLGSLFILKYKFWQDVAPRPRYACKGLYKTSKMLFHRTLYPSVLLRWPCHFKIWNSFKKIVCLE